MNILIFYMSKLPNEPNIPTEFYYTTDLTDRSIVPRRKNDKASAKFPMIVVPGVQTNEAATKYLILHLLEQNRTLDKIVYIATNEVTGVFKKKSINTYGTTKVIKNQSAATYYEKKIKKFCNSFDSVPEMVVVPGSGRNNTEVLSDIIKEINLDDNVFIDTTGGERNAVNLIQLLMKFLKYKGIKLEQAYYSRITNKHRDIPAGTISNCDDFFKQLDILDGVNQFVTTGSSDQLASCLGKSGNECINKLLDNMNDFADAMQLCNLNNLDVYLENMKANLNEVEKLEPKNNDEFILKIMASVIKDRFFKENGSINDYCSLISWCLENNMIQQALTLFTEKVPEVLFKKEYLYADSNYTKKVKETYDRPGTINLEAVMFYDRLMSRYKTAHLPVTDTRNLKDEPIDVSAHFAQRKNELMHCLSDAEYVSDNKEIMSVKTAINKYIDVLKAFDNPDDVRNEMSTNKSYSATIRKLAALSKEKGCYSPEKFINLITNNASFMKELLFPQTEVSAELSINAITMNKKLNCVLCIDSIFPPTGLYINIPKNKLKLIMLDYIYVKALRNRINHASDEENLNDEQKKIMRDFGYEVDKINTKTIKQQLIKALSHI